MASAHRALGAAAAQKRASAARASSRARKARMGRGGGAALRSCACRPRSRRCRARDAAARVPVVGDAGERKVDAPPIDAPMLVDPDEVVRLRKENAEAAGDLAAKADLLDTRWTRTTATSRAPTQPRRASS